MATILLVDDEPMLLSSLRRYLSGLGHEVRTASNGRDALGMLRETDLDLLITDVNLPEVSGIEILNTLASLGSKLPVIAMSGGGTFDDELLRDAAAQLGPTATIDKPFELQDLRRAVESVLG